MNGMTAMLALSDVSDSFITESILPGAEDPAAGLYVPDTPRERRRARRARVLESFNTGWGVAAACAVVCGAVLFACIRAGLGSPSSPAGSDSGVSALSDTDVTEADRSDEETKYPNRAYDPGTPREPVTPSAREQRTGGEPRIPSPTFPSVELPTLPVIDRGEPQIPKPEYPTVPSSDPWKKYVEGLKKH